MMAHQYAYPHPCSHGLQAYLEDHPTVPGSYVVVCDHDPIPEPAPPAWDPDVEQALEAIGEQVGAAVTPLAVALQETRQALVRMTPLYADLCDTLEAVLDVTARAGLSPSWVQDREILDHARDLIARTAPNGAPDATPPTDPGTPAG